MMRLSLMAAAATLALGAAPAAAQGGEAWQFRCPAPGTAVEQSTGATLRYRPGPERPGICNVGGQQRFLGYWSMREGFYQAGGTQLAATFGQGVAPGTMQPVIFDYFGLNRYSISSHYQERWRAEEGGSLTTPAGTFDTVKVIRDFNVIGVTFRYTQTVWFDRATNVPVQARIEHLNPVQAASLVNWVATDVTRNVQVLAQR